MINHINFGVRKWFEHLDYSRGIGGNQFVSKSGANSVLKSELRDAL